MLPTQPAQWKLAAWPRSEGLVSPVTRSSAAELVRDSWMVTQVGALSTGDGR